MKHLDLKSESLRQLEKTFGEHLDLLGYAQRTVKGSPLHIRELFHHMEQKGIRDLDRITSRHIIAHVRHVATRASRRDGGALSASSVNGHISSLRLFARFLAHTGRYDLEISPRRLTNETEEREILTLEEIRAVHEATYAPHRHDSIAMGQRDRAILAVLYGCGLRKAEAVNLDLSDIEPSRGILLVRKGKGGKQRHVPIAQRNLEELRDYIEEGRNWFLQDNSGHGFYYRKGNRRPLKRETDREALLLNSRGRRLQSFDSRLRELRERASLEKRLTAHVLRHSIATHLLISGMEIEDIARFLGHASLASTQIYTHITREDGQLQRIP